MANLKRQFKYGTNSIILTIVVIGIIVLLYIIVTRHHKRFDLTTNKKYSLSDQTLKVLKDLKKEIQITTFFKENNQEQQQVKDLLTEYTYKTNKIKLSIIDPDKNPSFTSKYGIKEYGVTVFECDTQRKDVTRMEVFEYQYGYYGQQSGPPTFHGEEAFTSAILAITEIGKKNIMFLEGHEEKDIDGMERDSYSGIKDILIKDNYEVKKINLLKESDKLNTCNVLIIAGPKKMIVDEEWNYIKGYLDNGGKVFILLDPLVESNLEKYLSPYGIKLKKDIVIDRGSAYFFDPFTPIPQYEDHKITEELLKKRVATILPGVRSVIKDEKADSSFIITPLLKTSNDSWAETNLQDKKAKFDKNQDIQGPFTTGLVITKEIKEKNQEMKLVLIGDSDFVNNSALGIQGNKDLFVNSVNWLMGEEKKISIRPITQDLKRLTITRKNSQLIFVGTVIVLPILILVIGAIVWLRRRSL